jgi:hypothetical protein
MRRTSIVNCDLEALAMVASVHVLHASPPEIGGFLRIGHTGHRKLEALLAANRLYFRRFVFDAVHIAEQIELVKSLRVGGCEIVLDPNSAEMAALGRFNSSVSKLPWGNPDRPWQPSDFGKGRNVDTAKAIAEFAMKYSVNAVLAPAHFVDSLPNGWTAVDLKLCEELRNELDRSGGKDVALDFQIITTNTLLRDSASRELLISSVRHLPIENVWIRASGFGATATGAATRSFMESVRCLHELQRPLIADYTGGLSGLAAAAFGVVGGMSHGVGQKETFRANSLNTPSRPGEREGSTKWIYVPELDRSFKQEQLDSLFGVRGARSRFGCNDSNCCANGPEDMIENPHVHFITQRSRQLTDLSNVPELRRAEHLLLRHLDTAVRAARLASRLHPDDEALVKAMLGSKKRLVNLRDTLGDLHAADGSVTRSSAPMFRGNFNNLSSAAGGQRR